MEELIKKAISLLDSKYNLPKKGFLAGGALANTVNKLKFGGKCVINDIDIFLLDEISEKVDYHDMPKSYTTNISKNIKFELVDTYRDTICLIKKDKHGDYITIKSIERNGIFNNMIFDSNKKDYYLLLNTFDINCTKVGYDLETNTAYWTKDFEEYIDTKQLKVSLPNTPSHTIVRILKKRDEMGAYLNKEEEFAFLSINDAMIKNIRKRSFSDKYYEIYLRYKSEIDEYFELKSSYFRPYSRVTDKISNEVINIHSLLPKNETITKILNKTNHIYHIDDYKYFFRNVYNNDKYIKQFWINTSFYFNNDNYVKKEDIEKLLPISYEIKMFTDSYEPVKILFKNLNIYQQIKYMEDLLLICNNNPKEMDFLRFHRHIIKYDNLEDLKDIVTLLKIKYRKNIYKKS